MAWLPRNEGLANADVASVRKRTGVTRIEWGGCPIRATPISPTEKQVCHSADNESASHEPIGGGMTDPRDACRSFCERRANVSARAVEGLPGHSDERPFKVERAVSFLNSDMPARHVGASRTFLPMGERGCLCPFGRCVSKWEPSVASGGPIGARVPTSAFAGKLGQGETVADSASRSSLEALVTDADHVSLGPVPKRSHVAES